MQENCFYHIYNRGNNKENIFLSGDNYEYFLKKFYRYLDNFVEVYAYCLMPNHFHFLIKVKDNIKNLTKENVDKYSLLPIEKAFRDFFIVYAKAFNNMYSRTGSLFQYKFKRKIITDNNYFIRVIAYIHNNPVRNNLCENASDWKYSSYSAIVSNKKTNVKRENVLEFFGNSKKEFEEFHKFYSTLIEDRDFLFKKEKRGKTTKV